MTQDQIILFALFGAVFALLIWGRWRYDFVAFAALMVALVAGVVPTKDAFTGFGHPATMVVALVLIVSAGLTRSGAVHLITRTLVDAGRSLGAHIALMGVVGGVLSAFMNNVAALALLMPVDVQTARKAGRAPGLSLMPLSFATILGGMATLIGTPPNIIIATYREDALGAPFAMFDFAPGRRVGGAGGAGLCGAGGLATDPAAGPRGGWRCDGRHRPLYRRTDGARRLGPYRQAPVGADRRRRQGGRGDPGPGARQPAAHRRVAARGAGRGRQHRAGGGAGCAGRISRSPGAGICRQRAAGRADRTRATATRCTWSRWWCR